ncbi:MAG: aminoacyl-tRNA hydrolase [Gammaproteobacteria bacterium]
MAETGIQLIVGLGNPGPVYAKTRHNVGTWLVETLSSSVGHPFHHTSKRMGQACRITLDHFPCWLFIPDTFMNNSGQAVRAFVNFHRIPPESILVAHDELDLVPGIIRLKKGGGHGGHNGLRDIIAHLGTADFYRFRIGIGHPGNREAVASFVLSRPSRDEELSISSAINDGLAVLPNLLNGDIAAAMQILHTTSKIN